MFYEIVIAPGYTPEGLECLKGKSKNLRILEAKPRAPSGLSLRQVSDSVKPSFPLICICMAHFSRRLNPSLLGRVNCFSILRDPPCKTFSKSVHLSIFIHCLLSQSQVAGGWLSQDADSLSPEEVTFTVVSEAKPTAQQLADVKFAWR